MGTIDMDLLRLGFIGGAQAAPLVKYEGILQ
jgi:hypothetical protein